MEEFRQIALFTDRSLHPLSAGILTRVAGEIGSGWLLMNAGNAAAPAVSTDEGREILSSETELNLRQSDRKVNGNDVPLEGYAFGEFDKETKKREILQLAPLPLERRKLSEYEIRLCILEEGNRQADGNPVKWAAFLVSIDRDQRTTKEISELLGISQRSFQGYVKFFRELNEEYEAELRNRGAGYE